MNYILPDDPEGNYWHYRVIQTENPGKELGCTNQYGAIWNGRFYLIAKQAKDGGASITGGRITVADATTLKIIKQIENIAPDGSQCDGRGFVGVSASKGYVSTSNGIWILDLNKIEITGKVKDRRIHWAPTTSQIPTRAVRSITDSVEVWYWLPAKSSPHISRKACW